VHRLSNLEALRVQSETLIFRLHQTLLDYGHLSVKAASISFMLLTEVELPILRRLGIKDKLSNIFADVLFNELRCHSILMLYLTLESAVGYR
jgi:hypothetical protein